MKRHSGAKFRPGGRRTRAQYIADNTVQSAPPRIEAQPGCCTECGERFQDETMYQLALRVSMVCNDCHTRAAVKYFAKEKRND